MVELGVRAVLIDSEGKVLMIRNSRGIHQNKLVLPGGRVEPKEPPMDAIKRELKEELGIECNLEFFAYDEDLETDPEIDYLILVFHGNYNGNPITPQSDEVMGYGFYSLEEIKNFEDIGTAHKNILLTNQEQIFP